MKINIAYIYSLCMLSLLAIYSCKQPDNLSIDHPIYRSASDTMTLPNVEIFKLTQSRKDSSVITPSQWDFNDDFYKLNFGSRFEFSGFKTKFSEIVSWKIIIEGKSSGATKTFSGTTDKIDLLDIKWKGESETVMFFKKGELIDFHLVVLGKEKFTFSKGEYRYVNNRTYPISSSKYVLEFEDFENPRTWFSYIDNDKDPFNYEYIDTTEYKEYPKFDPYRLDNETQYDYSTSTEFYIVHEDSKYVEKDNIYNNDKVRAIRGNHMFHMQGKDGKGKSSYFVAGGGGIYDGKYFDDLNKMAGRELTLDDVYLNFYANSNGNKTTRLDVEIRESVKEFNGETLKEDLELDKWVKEIDVSWDGWKLVSIRLSDMKKHPSQSTGDGILDLDKLNRIAFGLLSGNEGSLGNEVDLYIDFITFTIDKPYNQNLD